MNAPRRRPVPRAWREENHSLVVHATRHYGVRRGSGFYSRARGRCSCGVEFNPARLPDGTLSRSNTMDAGDVRDAWADHVEETYYAEQEPTP